MTTNLAEREGSGWGLPLHPEAIRLSEEEMARAAALVDLAEEPELAWTRYLRGLALAALSKELKHRNATITIGPELSPEDPQRLLALDGRATQLLCISPLADAVAVPLSPWRDAATAPQLLLLAQVDEDHGTVQFLGVLDAVGLVAEIRRLGASAQAAVELPLERFGGGLERLLRWVRLLEPDALPRAGLGGSSVAQVGERTAMAGLQQWLAQVLSSPTLMPLPVLGTRGGEAAVVRLITPEVKTAADGSAMTQAVCPTPSIWAETPLAEILLEQEGKVVWQQLATRRNPIEGPIRWPLDPLLPQQRLMICLRPYGAPGGAYAVVTLIAPDAAVMQEGDEVIENELRELLEVDPVVIKPSQQEARAVTAEARVRQWLAIGSRRLEVSSDD
ncbi:hypothetical protein [Synechococcus sp. EJ6-Ellesmere]|uniref:hypothetical protein n=1 Tax=Synechococcus sp. EJ6-Ellesmere TaxID=2823734 RepID=UPI0020CBF038|nr:hypothetical protein [Synechococcus sp. EJ6-Ellesmere]MCP9826227.1 hypothetical protein [Synechococcus sp. EJ6-Ellesmere]